MKTASAADTRIDREINVETRSKGKGVAGTMWVDKYRPKQFADLLGEDVSCCKFRVKLTAACAP